MARSPGKGGDVKVDDLKEHEEVRGLLRRARHAVRVRRSGGGVRPGEDHREDRGGSRPQRRGAPWISAEEHFAFNIIGAWVGPRTPIFLTTDPEDLIP